MTTTINITTNQQWLCPAGLTHFDLAMCGRGGPGGAGGQGQSSYGYGGPGQGGGAGEGATHTLVPVTPGQYYTITFNADGSVSAFGYTVAGGAAGIHGGSGFEMQHGYPAYSQTGANGPIAGASAENGSTNAKGNIGGGAGGGGYGAGGGGGGGGSDYDPQAGGAGGAGGPALVRITYGDLPSSDFSATPLIGPHPLDVTFTQTEAGVSRSWNFGDGTTSTSANPTHRYTATGAMTVILVVANSYGYTVTEKTGYITVKYFPCNQVISTVADMRGAS